MNFKVNPQDQISQLVRHQIEYYFSAENLDTDIYLRRKMDAQGYIPLNSIAAFNRVKSLSHDAELIIASVKQSTELELATVRNNDDYTDITNILVRPKNDPLKWPLSSPEPNAQSHLNPDVPEFVPKTQFNSSLNQSPQQKKQQQRPTASAPRNIKSNDQHQASQQVEISNKLNKNWVN